MDNDEFFTYTRILTPKLTDFVFSNINYEAKGITLSNNQCRLILQMLAHPERSISELGMRANIKKSTMTGIVHSLENVKILKKFTDGDDRRRTTLALTDLGYEIGHALRKKNKTNCIIKKNTLSDEDQKELEVCVKNLNKIMDKLKEKDNAQN
jgi:DNA-binding MarR family transcriptional regulator